MSSPDETLVALARSRGVATEYWNWLGEHVLVSAETIRTVLAALGVAASTPLAAQQALAAEADLAWRRTLPATVVCREGERPRVPVHAPDGVGVRLSIECEAGGIRHARPVDRAGSTRIVDRVPVGETVFELDADLPLGWHRLRVDLAEGPVSTAALIVTPRRLSLPPVLEQRRVWGLMHQIYALGSDQSWGMGDLADLAELATWSGAELGADYLLVNPLHAAQPISPIEASPYRPATRRFVNPLYLRPEEICEAVALSEAGRSAVSALARRAHTLNQQDLIDRDAIWAAKCPALRLIHAAPQTPHRQAEFRGYRDREGAGLVAFATWCTLAEAYGLPWHSWPAELQDPGSAAVSAFAEAHAHEVDFHCWLQWQLAEQLATAQRQAVGAGMSLGLVHDLAVGVHPDGADAWALGDALARSVSVGAPPDQFNQLGQDWQQPPWRPDALAELGYQPYRDMLRTVLRDAGGIRVDHVMGLFRLWWVPAGRPATEGTYVYYDPEAMIGVLALEAHRAGAVVIGEDLGVVEPRVRDYLNDRGMLGTSILWFEVADGVPLPPQSYRTDCLATVTTHDLPPTAGFLALEHVAIRERPGLLTRTVEEERAAERQAIEAVRTALRGRGLVKDVCTEQGAVEALYAYLVLTPARMLGVAVPDLVGDRRAVNQPGTDTEYPNWRVPVSGPDGRPISLADLKASARAASLADVLRHGLEPGR